MLKYLSFVSLLVIIYIILGFTATPFIKADPPSRPTSTPAPLSLTLSMADIDGAGVIQNVVVQGDYAYIAAGEVGLRILNISNPEQPFEVAQFDTAGYALEVAVVEDYAYIADELYGLRIIDVSNPANPRQVSVYDTLGVAHHVIVADHYAYLLGDGNLRIIDVADPQAPIEIGLHPNIGFIEQIAIENGYAYLASPGQGILIVDLTDQTQPKTVGEYVFTEKIEQIVLSQSELYLVMAYGGLQVVNVAEPDQPFEVATYEPEGCTCPNYKGLVRLNGTIYASGCPGLVQLELTPSDELSIVQSYHLDWLIKNPQLDGETMYGHRYINGQWRLLLLPDLTQQLATATIFVEASPSPSPTATLKPSQTPVKPQHWSTPYPMPPRPKPPRHEHNLEIVGHLGGEIAATATDGRYLYANFGREFAIMTVSQPLTPTRVGYLMLPHPIERLHVEGGYAYVSDSQDIVWVIDVSAPTTPQQIGFLDTKTGVSGRSKIMDITQAGDHLYLATQYRSLLIVDVSDPTQPVEVPQIMGDGWWGINKIVVRGDYAFVPTAEEGGVRVVDVSDPTQPRLVSFIRQKKNDGADRNIANLALIDNQLYFYRGEKSAVFDISSPTNPIELEAVSTQPEWYSTTVAGHVYQVSKAGNLLISEIGSAETAATYHSWSTTNAPLLLSDPSTHQAYLGINDHQLATIDLSQPRLPKLTVTHTTSMATHFAFVQHDSYLYQAAGSEGLKILDVTNQLQPIRYRNPITGPVIDVALEWPYLYVAQGRAGVTILEVSQPTSPTKVGHYQPSALWVSQVTVVDQMVYLSGYVHDPTMTAPNRRYQLRLVDVTTPAQPLELTTYNLSHWIWDVQVAAPYLYLVDSRGQLRILDLSLPDQPVEIGTTYLPNQAYQLVLSSSTNPQYAYVAAGVDGLRVIDVSDPTAPTEIAFYDTPGDMWQIGLKDNLIYGTDSSEGLYIFRLKKPLLKQPSEPVWLEQTDPISPIISPLSPYKLADLAKTDFARDNYLVQHRIISRPAQDVEIGNHGYYYFGLVPLASTTALEIRPSHHGQVHYLLYQGTPENHWVFQGHVQHFAVYGTSNHRFITNSTGDRWLITNHFAEGGGSSGSALFEERWVWLNEGYPNVVLRYPDFGQTNLLHAPYAKFFSSTVEVLSDGIEEKFMLDIHFTAKYATYKDSTPDNEASDLFTTTGRLRYVWQPAQAEFTYLPDQSTLSPHQVDRIGSLTSFADQMLQNNFETLIEQWVSGEPEFRHWSVLYLGLQADSEEQRRASWRDIPGPPEKQMLMVIMKDTM